MSLVMACNWYRCLPLCFLVLCTGYTLSPPPPPPPTLRFANIYGDHMVLQQAPHQAHIWGVVPHCDPVTVRFNNKTYTATIVPHSGSPMPMCKWRVTLPATQADSKKSYVITATSEKHGNISLKDVLFGDVWVCSGQSNMQFTVPQVYNASQEIATAAKYPLVRLFTASLVSSSVQVDELLGVEQEWSVAGPETINGSAWMYFSASCWFFGRNIFDSLNYPIGLIATDWGGTPVEAWSSPDALAKCKKTNEKEEKSVHGTHSPDHDDKSPGPDPHTPSVLWNSMIYPLLNMTIKGAIWYQGEANAVYPYTYNCTFPAMIDDWREKWSTHTMKQTDPLMGFGFVQLAPTGNDKHAIGGFPVIRWAQTADYGYVPNTRLRNVFMAVAVDLGDPTSPYGSVHPRDKQDVGLRLAMSARAVVYGENIIDFQGPIPKTAVASPPTDSSVKVSVSFQYHGALETRSSDGFEVGCGSSDNVSQWYEGTVGGVNKDEVILQFPKCPSGSPVMVRYLWRTDPCDFKLCAVYDHMSQLPAAPFIMKIS